MKYEYYRIRDLREDKDLTQEEIAKILNVYTTTYQRWERGETEIPAHIIIKLCKYYKVSADYILNIKFWHIGTRNTNLVCQNSKHKNPLIIRIYKKKIFILAHDTPFTYDADM